MKTNKIPNPFELAVWVARLVWQNADYNMKEKILIFFSFKSSKSNEVQNGLSDIYLGKIFET